MNARSPDTELVMKSGPAGNVAPIAATALYQQVAERLRTRILAHEIPPGSWIDEQALAEQYGISRTPLREALKVLVSEGLVTLKPRRGCYVTEVTAQDMDEIFPILALLEGRCAFEATSKASAADLAALDQLQVRLEEAAARNNVEDFFEANQRFHRALQALAGNRWLVQIIEDMRKVLKLNRHQSLSREGRLTESLEEHRGIMQALHARDAAAAQARMHQHLLQGREALAKLTSQSSD